MKNFWKRHIDKVGLIGSLFSALCCVGIPALVSFVFAVGLGWLINDAILIPLLVLFLVITLLGLFFGMKDHRRPWAFIIGILSAIIIFFFIAIRFNKTFVIIGIIFLVIASLMNLLFQIKKR